MRSIILSLYQRLNLYFDKGQILSVRHCAACSLDRWAFVHLMAESVKALCACNRRIIWKCMSHLFNVCKVGTSCATESGIWMRWILVQAAFDWWLQVICFPAGRFFWLTDLTGGCFAFILRLRQSVIEACQVETELKPAWDHLSGETRWDWVPGVNFLAPYFDPLLVALCSDEGFHNDPPSFHRKRVSFVSLPKCFSPQNVILIFKLHIPHVQMCWSTHDKLRHLV